MHISLTDTLDQYVRAKVESGLYNNASEVIREALRRQIASEQSEEEKLEELRRKIMVGWEQAERGEFVEFELGAFLKELDAEWEAGQRE